MPKKEISFENAMDRLDEIVSLLENGECQLEEALNIFEEGISLVKICNKKLETAEKSIKILVNQDGEFIEKDFIPKEENND